MKDFFGVSVEEATMVVTEPNLTVIKGPNSLAIVERVS